MTRQASLDYLRTNPEISVLIIGGGINGIGTFRDLALQGVDVLLVEKGDYSSGASAASSHMVHGGLRYLENAEFRLVREALTERNRLLQNAPHQVFPLPTTIPIFGWFSGILTAPLTFAGLRDKPGSRGSIVIKLGLLMYDWFTRGQQTLPKHVFNSRSKSLARRPMLNPDIVATATYYDAWMPTPERICIELIKDAEESSKEARALNYVKAVGVDSKAVVLEDQISGERYRVKPKVVINAAGPWIDFANENLNHPTHFIGGTKGSHILVNHPELHAATQGHEMFFENKDGRITLFFPLKERVLIGTTDIRLDDPDAAVCTEEEVDYMLEMVKIVFPNIDVNRSHIVFRFSGVRPLPFSDSSTTGQISRDHSIRTVEANANIPFPILSLVGGKWTTFRAFSEQVADEVLKRLGQSRRSRTIDIPIGGGKGYPKANREKWLSEHQAQSGISRERLETLFDRYGTQALDVLAYINAGDDAPLNEKPDYTRREIAYLIEQESVLHLDDLLLRRTLIAMLGYVTYPLIEEAAEIASQILGWSDDQTRAEINYSIQQFEQKNGLLIRQAQPHNT